jgi:hypothetical protein
LEQPNSLHLPIAKKLPKLETLVSVAAIISSSHFMQVNDQLNHGNFKQKTFVHA